MRRTWHESYTEPLNGKAIAESTGDALQSSLERFLPLLPQPVTPSRLTINLDLEVISLRDWADVQISEVASYVHVELQYAVDDD